MPHCGYCGRRYIQQRYLDHADTCRGRPGFIWRSREQVLTDSVKPSRLNTTTYVDTTTGNCDKNRESDSIRTSSSQEQSSSITTHISAESIDNIKSRRRRRKNLGKSKHGHRSKSVPEQSRAQINVSDIGTDNEFTHETLSKHGGRHRHENAARSLHSDGRPQKTEEYRHHNRHREVINENSDDNPRDDKVASQRTYSLTLPKIGTSTNYMFSKESQVNLSEPDQKARRQKKHSIKSRRRRKTSENRHRSKSRKRRSQKQSENNGKTSNNNDANSDSPKNEKPQRRSRTIRFSSVNSDFTSSDGSYSPPPERITTSTAQPEPGLPNIEQDTRPGICIVDKTTYNDGEKVVRPDTVTLTKREVRNGAGGSKDVTEVQRTPTMLIENKKRLTLQAKKFFTRQKKQDASGNNSKPDTPFNKAEDNVKQRFTIHAISNGKKVNETDLNDYKEQNIGASKTTNTALYNVKNSKYVSDKNSCAANIGSSTLKFNTSKSGEGASTSSDEVTSNGLSDNRIVCEHCGKCDFSSLPQYGRHVALCADKAHRKRTSRGQIQIVANGLRNEPGKERMSDQQQKPYDRVFHSINRRQKWERMTLTAKKKGSSENESSSSNDDIDQSLKTEVKTQSSHLPSCFKGKRNAHKGKNYVSDSDGDDDERPRNQFGLGDRSRQSITRKMASSRRSASANDDSSDHSTYRTLSSDENNIFSDTTGGTFTKHPQDSKQTVNRTTFQRKIGEARATPRRKVTRNYRAIHNSGWSH